MLNSFYEAEAPSNIALIKYMGKIDGSKNKATNSSLSFTLPHLISKVKVRSISQGENRWEPLDGSIHLSEVGLKKFLDHWERCRRAMAPSFGGKVLLVSGNNFPSDCGLASSASSFAALTKAAHTFFKGEGALEKDWTSESLALLSRQGSGSSCRSLFDSWVLWSDDQIGSVEAQWGPLRHTVVVADDSPKKVSSSQAHLRVQSSSLFEGRMERAEKRCGQFLELLKNEDSWRAMFEVAWAEFWDMHNLFETSVPPFYYMMPQSLLALRYLQDHWESQGDGPLITMDAGPNIHLLYRQNQGDLQEKHRESLLAKGLKVIVSLGEHHG